MIIWLSVLTGKRGGGELVNQTNQETEHYKKKKRIKIKGSTNEKAHPILGEEIVCLSSNQPSFLSFLCV